MSIKHTPGPWVAHKYKKQDVNGLGYIVLQDKQHNSANISTVIPMIGMEEREVEANAKLIAAAPELLNALIDAFEFIKNVDDWRGADPNMQLFENAIKKATE